MVQTLSNAHVMIVSPPIHGHVNPMLQLAVHLSSMGCNVTFLTTSSTHNLAASTLHNICKSDESSAYLHQERINLHAIDDGNRSSGYDFGESIHFLIGRASQIGDIVKSQAHGSRGPVTFTILDLIVVRSLRKVPAIQHLPCAAFITTSLAMMHIVISVETLLERGYLPMSSENALKTVDSSIIPGSPVDLCVYSDIPQDPEDPSYKPMCEVRKAILEAPTLLLNTSEELEKELLGEMRRQGVENIVCIGPLMIPSPNNSGTADATGIISWLEKQAPESVIYASFGTMMELPAEQVAELAYGMEGSRQPFVFVIPRGLMEMTEVAGVVEEVRMRVGERGMIVPWSPQFDVLRHPSTGGFLTHCGFNSVMESLTCGVPMIGIPRGGDHPIIGKHLVDVWKVGNRIIPKNPDGSPRLVGRDEIQSAIKELMSSDKGREMKARAKSLGQKLVMDMILTRDKLGQILNS